MIDGSHVPASSLLGRALRLPLRLISPTRQMRILSGHLSGARWIAGAATHGCWLGTYERHSQHLAKALVRPGDTVFDLGANVGFFTLLFSHLTGPQGRVIAFEPLPRNIQLLSEHVALNACANVEIVPAAVADHRGRAQMACGQGPSQAALNVDGDLEVAVTTLDFEIEQRSISAPMVVKLDVEGAECQVLAGATETLARHKASFWIETHGWRAHEGCREVLRNSGYELISEQATGQSGHGRLVGVAAEPVVNAVARVGIGPEQPHNVHRLRAPIYLRGLPQASTALDTKGARA